MIKNVILQKIVCSRIKIEKFFFDNNKMKYKKAQNKKILFST